MKRIGVNFHGVGEPARALESGESNYWLSQIQFNNVLDMVCDKGMEKFVLTFDDGNVSDYDIALPALTARGLCAAFFVPTGRIGEVGSLNSMQLRRLLDAGMVLGSHGVEHVDWSALSPSDLRKELVMSKTTLEQFVQNSITKVGIPFGKYNRSVLAAIKEAGYLAAYSSDGGAMRIDRFVRPRTSLRGDMSLNDIRDILSGQMSGLDAARRFVGMSKRQWCRY